MEPKATHLMFQSCYTYTELLSHIQLFVILWTVACQTPLSITEESITSSRQEY